jgi:hypothetical protein
MSLLLLIILLLVVFGGLPNWGYHNYGYAPSGIGGIILIIVLILPSDRAAELLTFPSWWCRLGACTVHPTSI